MKKKILTVVLVISLGAGCCLPGERVAAKTTEEQLEDAEDEYEDTGSQLLNENANLEDLKDQKEDLQSALDELTSKLEQASSILEELDTSIQEKKDQIDATWGRIEELSTQIDQTSELADREYELAKEQIQFAYESGDVLTQALLFGGSSYSAYINRGSYMQMLTQYQQDKVKALVEAREALKEQQSEYEDALIELEEEKTQLDEYEDSVAKEHEQINELISVTAEKVQTYQDQIEETEARIDQYEADREAQENNISALKEKLKEEQEKIEESKTADWKDISEETYTSDERKLLANIIWCEAGNQPYEGMVAVGAVVMNRVSSAVYPNTISGVIYQSGQFTPASSGKLSLALSRDSATEDCYRAADAAMAGVNNIGSCLYFRTPTSSVSPSYIIGDHYFY